MLIKPTNTPYIRWGAHCPKGTVSHFHVLETLATTSQSSRRTGPSSPPSELLLARVDTGRGVVRLALGRSDRGTALHRRASLLQLASLHHVPALLVVILVA